ncbi:MAG: hypothetical protein ABIO92_07525 [Chloroflexia bacterium]
MATRNRPPGTQRATPPRKWKGTQPPPTTSSVRSVPETGRKTRSGGGLGNLPIEGHRALASLVLALMMLLTLFAPLVQPGSDPTPFLTPRIDGSGSILQAGGAANDIERSLFSYSTFVDRSVDSTGTSWPEVIAALRFDPTDTRARMAIVGQMYASTSGALNMRLKETGIESRPSPIKLQEYEDAYRPFFESDERGGRGSNGLSAMALMRSLTAEGEERRRLELLAIDGFREAINQNADIWQYTHNWALANMLVGNYAQANEGMRVVTNRAAEDNDLLAGFWSGLAALRIGDPGEAIQVFTPLSNRQAPPGGNDTFNELFVTLRTLSREGLADAQGANRDPSGAYRTYFDTLLLGEIDSALYSKWLRLGLQLGAYEKLAADMSSLTTSSGFRNDSRIRHDRARLLDLLGRRGEAESEYKEALRLENDPGLLIAYGQSLESRGDHDGALAQAREVILKLNNDPETADLSSVARVATTFATPVDISTAQQLLDANLLRARAWGRQGNAVAVESLAQRIVQNAEGLTPEQVGLLYLYAGFANESAGLADKARESYSAAWDRLKASPPGTVGRGEALAGLERTTTGEDPSNALKVLSDNGYNPNAPAKSLTLDPDAPDIMLQAGVLLRAGGQEKEAANAMRVASILSNLRDVRALSGIGRPIWAANGTSAPFGLALQAAGAAREGDGWLAAARYRQAISLDPALAPAWNNLGVYYAQNGNQALGRFYLQSAATISPNYAWGQQNLAALGYKQGPGNFFAAEEAQGDAIKSVGPQALSWGHQLRYDERGVMPSPALPPTDFLSRIPALLLLTLLLLHTLIGGDRLTNRMGVLPARSLLGRLGLLVDAQAKTTVPNLITPQSDMRSLLIALAIPSVIGMLALAWGISGGTVEVFLIYLPVALLASIIAFGGNELAQRMAARARNSYTMHHNWVLGIILGVLSIPFGFVYGWQTVTRIQPVSGSGQGDGFRSGKGQGTRTTEERELLEESQIEAAADEGSREAVTVGMPAGGVKMPSKSWIGGNQAVSIMVAGLALNLAVGLLAGIAYWLTGWPSMRIITFASILVLAFTAVSDPPADGWTLYRRNPPLWLALFVFASVLATLLALKMV